MTIGGLYTVNFETRFLLAFVVFCGAMSMYAHCVLWRDVDACALQMQQLLNILASYIQSSPCELQLWQQNIGKLTINRCETRHKVQKSYQETSFPMMLPLKYIDIKISFTHYNLSKLDWRSPLAQLLGSSIFILFMVPLKLFVSLPNAMTMVVQKIPQILVVVGWSGHIFSLKDYSFFSLLKPLYTIPF